MMEKPDITAPEGESTEETCSVPLSMVGAESKPGDVIRMRVVSVDSENGTAQMAYSDSQSAHEDEHGEKVGVAKMAAEFD